MVTWYEGKRGKDTFGMGVRPILITYHWIPFGPGVSHHGYLDLGIYVDSLTIAMFAMVAIIAAIVHLFSIGSMRREPGFSSFFAGLGLLCFAMFGLILSATFLQAIIFWQLLGLFTYMMVGFWIDKPAAAAAAQRTFVIQCLGNAGLLIGVGIMAARLGTLTMPLAWAALGNAAAGQAVALPGGGVFSTGLATWMGIALFSGAVARSAQFPLQFWLADATQAPPPAGAMICSATTLAAGVYFIGRVFPLLTPDARLLIAIIGLATLVMAALIAVAQTDLLRVLAWSSVSQVGFMMMALGVGSWMGGMFHLITHGFFQSLLFLCAAGVMAATGTDGNMRDWGGLWRKIPVTGATFLVAVLAIAAAPLFSGYYSQSIMITDAAAFSIYATRVGGRGGGYWLFFVLPMVVAYLTAFYMAKCWLITFLGAPRNVRLYARAREHPSLWGPPLALAFLSVISGYAMNVPELLAASIAETKIICADLSTPNASATGAKFRGFDGAWPALRPAAPEGDSVVVVEPSPDAASPAARAHEAGHSLARSWLNWAWIVGIALAGCVYFNGDWVADRLMQAAPVRWVHTWLLNGMFFEELYEWTIVNLVAGLVRLVGAIDRYLINGGIDLISRLVGRAIRLNRPAKPSA